MKPIPGFPGYTISEAGVITNPKGKVLTRKDSWEGYPRARLKHESGRFVNRKIHSLVALAHLGEGKEVRHLDNDRANFHLHNLEWGDRTSNAQDRLARGSYHLKTKLVRGKSLLILGDDKYLDPEAKKVYHVTQDPIGSDGVTPVESLDKIAGLFSFLSKPKVNVRKVYTNKVHENIFQRITPVELLPNSKTPSHLLDPRSPKGIKENFGIPKKLRDVADQGNEKAKSLIREHAFNSRGFIKKAEWTSKKNANKHALKHAAEMGLTKEQYIALAKSALKDNLSAISVKNDALKSRDSKGNILVHKDGKVISYFSKVAYVRKIRKHLEKAVTNAMESEQHGNAFDVYQRRQEQKYGK